MKVNFIAQTRKRLIKPIISTMAVFFAINCAFALTVFTNPTSLTYKHGFNIINKGENPESNSAMVSSSVAIEVTTSTSATWLTCDPPEFSLTPPETASQEVAINYNTADLDPGVYTATVTIGGQSFSVSIKIVDPEIYIWTWDPADRYNPMIPDPSNEDLQFTNPQSGVDCYVGTNSWSVKPTLWLSQNWPGKGIFVQEVDYRTRANNYIPSLCSYRSFKIWNTGFGTVQYKLTNIEYHEERPFDWLRGVWTIEPDNVVYWDPRTGGMPTGKADSRHLPANFSKTKALIDDKIDSSSFQWYYQNYNRPYHRSSIIQIPTYEELSDKEKGNYMYSDYRIWRKYGFNAFQQNGGSFFYSHILDPPNPPLPMGYYFDTEENTAAQSCLPIIDLHPPRIVNKAVDCAGDNILGNFDLILVGCSAFNDGTYSVGTDQPNLEPGTYSATITIEAQSIDTEGAARYSQIDILVIFEVGTKFIFANVDGDLPFPWTPNADLHMNGPSLTSTGAMWFYNWEFASDQDPKFFWIDVSTGGIEDSTAYPSDTDYPYNRNSNHCDWHIVKRGAGSDVDCKWMKVDREEGSLDVKQWDIDYRKYRITTLEGSTSQRIYVHTDVSDLYPGDYTGYLYFEANDGFGKDAANTTFQFDPANPDSAPTTKVLASRSGNILQYSLFIQGPTMGLSSNSIDEVLDFTDIIKDDDGVIEGTEVYIWNKYGNMGKLHYNYEITGENGEPVDWLSLKFFEYGYEVVGAGEVDANGRFYYDNVDYGYNPDSRIFERVYRNLRDYKLVYNRDTDQSWTLVDPTGTILYKKTAGVIRGQYVVVNGTGTAPLVSRIPGVNQIVKGHDYNTGDTRYVDVSGCSNAAINGRYENSYYRPLLLSGYLSPDLISTNNGYVIIDATDYNGTNPSWQIYKITNSVISTTPLYEYDNSLISGYYENVNATGIPPSVVAVDLDTDSYGPDNRDIIVLNYDTTSLVPGNYNATVTFTGDKDPNGNEICENSPQYLHVNVRVLGPIIASNVSDLNPVCVIGGNPENEDEFLVWNSDEPVALSGHAQSVLNFTITTSESWLTCTNTNPNFLGKASGDSEGPKDQDTIKVSYTTTGLSAGTHTADITITDELTGNTRVINVTLTTIAPVIATNTQEINVVEDFGVDPQPVTFDLWNADTFGTDLYYSISQTGSWFTMTDNKGDPKISTGPQDRRDITVSFDVSGLSPGKYSGQITVTGVNAIDNKVINMTLEIKAATVVVTPTSLFPKCLKGNDAVNDILEVWNGAYSTLNYAISTEYTDESGLTDWVSCDPKSGTSEDATDKQKITVSYKTSKLPAGTYTAIIIVSDPNSSNTSETVTVTLVVQEPQISISKTEITQSTSFTETASPSTFQVKNSATGNLYYQITDDADYKGDDWMMVIPPSPALSTGEPDTITIHYYHYSPNPSFHYFTSGDLPIGSYTATITIKGFMDEEMTIPTTPASETIVVTLKVGAVVGVTTAELKPSCYQGTNAESETFKVFNGGVSGTKLNYTITEGIEWLELSPKTGESEGEKDTITVTYNTRSLTPEVYTGKITVSNDDEPTDTQEIIVTLAVKSGAIIASDSTSIDVSCGQGYSPDPVSLQIWNSGKGTLGYTIEVKEADYNPAVATAWITNIDPASGTSANSSEIKTSTITFDTSALSTGTYKALLTVSDPLAENTPYTVDVNLSILGPTISVDPSTISATAEAGGSATQTFQVWNSGGGTLTYELADNAEWLTLDITSGDSTGVDDKDTITATCSAAELSSGTYEATITVTSETAGVTNSPQIISVSFGVGMPEIATSVSKLSPKATSGTDAPEESFEVWNASAGTLEYKVAVDVAWLSISPTSGDSTSESDKDELTVTYKTDELAVGNYEGNITIADTNAINSPFTIPVTLTISDEVPDTGLLIQLSASGEGLTKDEENRVSFWPNEVNSGKLNNAQQRNLKQQPVVVSDILNGNSALFFACNQSMDINLTETTDVNARTIAMVFRTGGDISTRQLLFEQGDANNGFNFYIENKFFYANAWNLTNAGGLTQWGPVSISSQLLGYQTYYVTMVFDPDNAQVVVYLNGSKLGTGVANKMFYPNFEMISLGADVNGTKYPTDTKKRGKGKGLYGYIAEFLYYNEAINESTRLNLESYLQTKYNVTETDVRIADMALWLRAELDTVIIKNELVKEWRNRADSSKKGVTFKMGSKKKRPSYTENVVNKNAGVTFNGLGAYMMAKNDVNINSSKIPYSSRSMFVVFKTGSDISTRQVIWTEGFKKSGVNIYVESGQLYMGAWGSKAPKGEVPWSAVFISASGLAANTVYCAQLNLEATSGMEGFLNGASIGSSTSVGKLYKHKPATLGAVKRGSILNGGVEVKKGDYFNGNIMELLVYNAILSASEVLEMENYLKSRYGISFE